MPISPASLALPPLNHLLTAAGWARTRLARHAGRSFRVSLPPIELFLRVGDDGLFAVAGEEAQAEVEISLPAASPMLLVEGLQALFRSARVSGAADFAEDLGFVFRHLEWDVEADLARFTGDIAAHRLVRGGRGLLAWQKDAATRFTAALAEYFTREHPLLPLRADVAGFLGEADTLRDDLARLEKRIERAERLSSTANK